MAARPTSRLLAWRPGYFSAGAWIIVVIAVASSLAIMFRPVPVPHGLQFWSTAREHFLMYAPVTDQWNQTHDSANQVSLQLYTNDALSHRMLSGFLSDVPVADLIEVERSLIGLVFAGPLKDVGFVDLTQRLHTDTLDGRPLIDAINSPSFSPWTSRGRIFGLPHDVHPVMLCYRSDLVEAAGIDVSKIETWDDFVRVMHPLEDQLDADGKPQHYLLNIWYTSFDQIEVLMMEAGGGFFDSHDQLAIDSPINAHVIATVISWTLGPHRISADAPEFNASGDKLRQNGYVICNIVPDWLCGIYKDHIPQLSGKVKLMRLPAWTPGGLRTSVWGGTMLGITKDTSNFDTAWTYAKKLYLTRDMAKTLYETNCIISPVKSFWDSPFYDTPDPYFSGQAIGRLYIAQAPFVPRRTASPFYAFAKYRMIGAVVRLRQYAEDNHIYDADQLEHEAHVLLGDVQGVVRREMDRNTFAGEK